MEPSHLSAASILENEDGEILMVQEGKKHVKGKWDFPGGGIDNAEGIQAGIKREVKEETGYLIEPENLVGIYMEESCRTGNTVVLFLFESKIVGKGETDPDSENEILEKSFFEKEKLKDLELRKENRSKMIEDYLAGKSFSKETIKETRSL